jgi:hypothetical protein
VVVVAAGDDTGLVGRDALLDVTPFAGGLQGGFDAFGAGVHGEDGFHAAEVRQRAAERAELVVVERAGSQRDAVELGLGGGDQFGGTVAEVHRGIGGEHVHVAFAVGILDPNALGTGNDHR